MLFVELRFFVFLAVVLGVHWALRDRRQRKLWLLLSSYVFYGAWDWRFLSLILLSTAVDHRVGLALAREGGRRKAWLLLSLVVNLGLLGFFKYFGFFSASFAELVSWFGGSVSATTLDIVLPVGISFYTFQTLSYSIDVYHRKLEPRRDTVDFALFVAFFPQLVAGPIVRASHFLPQLDQDKRWRDVALRPAVLLFLIGFFKKACVSDNLAPFVDAVFSDPGAYDAGSTVLGVVLYAVQIYCDFSGYSDMAIAVAVALGYDLGRNFDFPYVATSVADFWHRWHISLSTWLRDYLYIPLGGNRSGPVRTYLNLMTTMVLGGLWHGASWNFVLWGLLHGAALSAHRLLSSLAAARGRETLVPAAAGWLVTMWWVGLTWIPFRAVDFADSWRIGRIWCGLGGAGERALPSGLWALLAVVALLHLAAWKRWPERLWEGLSDPTLWFVTGAAASLLLALRGMEYVPFIYFQF